MVEIVKLDSKGRVFIPIRMREASGFREGMYAMIVADLERREVTITPFADPEAKLVEFRIGLTDAPGALARVAMVLANAKIDLLSTESRTIRRGEQAEWIAIADASKCTMMSEDLKARILKEGAAETVDIRWLSSSSASTGG